MYSRLLLMSVMAIFDMLLFVYVLANKTWKLTADTR